MTGILLLLFLAWILYLIFGRKTAPSPMVAGTVTPVREVPAEPIIYPHLFWVSLVATLIAWNVFLYDTLPLIGITGFAVIMILSMLLSFEKQRRTPLVLATAAIALIAAVGVGFRANGFVQSVNIVTIVLCSLLLSFLRSSNLFEARFFWLFKNFISMIGKFFSHVINLFAQHKIAGKEQKWSVGSLIKTVAITVVVLLFFVGLLSSADPVFSKLVEEFREQIMGRAILTIILAIITAAALTLQLKTRKDDEYKFGFLRYQDLIVPTVAVVVLFGVFLFVQAKYLFGGQADFAAFNISYSEYVTKGFMELLTVALFGGLLSYLVILKNREVSDDSKMKTLLSVNGILIFELMCMLGSALKRDLMYVDTYGLTRVRIIGGIFLLWLATLLVLLFLLNLKKLMQEKVLLTGMFAASVVVVLFLNVVNVDALVVRGAPGHHEYTDYFYINNLSSDAVSGWSDSISQIETQFTTLKMKGSSLSDKEKSQLAGLKLAAISLQEMRNKLDTKYNSDIRYVISTYYPADLATYDKTKILSKIAYSTGPLEKIRSWQAWNWSESNAYSQINGNRSLYFTTLDRLVQEIKASQYNFRLDLSKEERRLLYDFSYPFLSIDSRYYPQSLSDVDREIQNPARPGQLQYRY